MTFPRARMSSGRAEEATGVSFTFQLRADCSETMPSTPAFVGVLSLGACWCPVSLLAPLGRGHMAVGLQHLDWSPT